MLHHVHASLCCAGEALMVGWVARSESGQEECVGAESQSVACMLIVVRKVDGRDVMVDAISLGLLNRDRISEVVCGGWTWGNDTKVVNELRVFGSFGGQTRSSRGGLG